MAENSWMNYKKVSRYVVLAILFFLPVTFLLFLYPSTHNYTALDIVKEKVMDLENFRSNEDSAIFLKNHITILNFVGNDPQSQSTAVSNLKELVYDKFKGFKTFQIVTVAPLGLDKEVEKLYSEIRSYEDLKFWHFVFGSSEDIKKLYKSLKTRFGLKDNLSSNMVFIIDKDLSQRGRVDDRTDKEIESNKAIYGLYGYDCIEVATIKNKMSDDLRILFTEYRQKRKGEFNSDARRANDIKQECN